MCLYGDGHGHGCVGDDDDDDGGNDGGGGGVRM